MGRPFRPVEGPQCRARFWTLLSDPRVAVLPLQMPITRPAPARTIWTLLLFVWPGTWMKSTCQPHYQWQQRRPPHKLKQLQPQAHKRRRHRRRTTKLASRCLPVRVTLCYLTCMFSCLCSNRIQQCKRRACCASCSQSGYTCGKAYSASNSATATSYSRPGPKSGVRSWLRNLILMTINHRQALWCEGSSSGRMGWRRQRRCPQVHTARAEA